MARPTGKRAEIFHLRNVKSERQQLTGARGQELCQHIEQLMAPGCAAEDPGAAPLLSTAR